MELKTEGTDGSCLNVWMSPRGRHSVVQWWSVSPHMGLEPISVNVRRTVTCQSAGSQLWGGSQCLHLGPGGMCCHRRWISSCGHCHGEATQNFHHSWKTNWLYSGSSHARWRKQKNKISSLLTSSYPWWLKHLQASQKGSWPCSLSIQEDNTDTWSERQMQFTYVKTSC